jgi:hypothetical protein
MPGLTARRSIAWLLALAVPVGTFYAPFVHAHVGEDAHGDRGHAGAVHAHLSGHERGDHDHDGPAVRDDDHDLAIYLKAYVAERTPPSDVPAVPPQRLGLDSPGERAAHPAVVVTHGHDPPLHPALGSRPPPPSPVLI